MNKNTDLLARSSENGELNVLATEEKVCKPEDTLTKILMSVPRDIWEDLGYANYKTLTISKNPERSDGAPLLKFTFNYSWTEVERISLYEHWWDLARLYKPYHDFCLERIGEIQKEFSQPTAYKHEKKDNEAKIEKTILLHCPKNMYLTYFYKMNLKDDFLERCAEKMPLSTQEIVELMQSATLQQFVEYVDKPQDECFKQLALLKKETSYDSTADFAKAFLSDDKDIDECSRKLRYLMDFIEREIGEDKYEFLDSIGTIKGFKHKILNYKFWKSEEYTYAMAIGTFEGYYVYSIITLLKFLKLEKENLKDVIEFIERLYKYYPKEIIDYFCNTADTYLTRCATVQFCKDDVVIEKDYYGYTARYKEHIRMADDEKTVLSKIEETYKFEKTKEIIDELIDNYFTASSSHL